MAWILLVVALLIVVALIFLSRKLWDELQKVKPEPPRKKSDELAPAVLHTGLYNTLVMSVAAIASGFVLVAVATWQIVLLDEGFGVFNLGLPILAVPLIYLGLSIKVTAKDQVGAIYFLGLALKNVGSGPSLVLFGLMTLDREAGDLQEIEMPGPRDLIFREDEKLPLPKGMVRPIFVNSRSQVAGEDRALDVQMQYEVEYFIMWGVSDDLATFRKNSRTLAEADSMLKKISLSTLDQIVGRKTTEGVIASQENTNDEFDDAICKKAASMGIRIYQAGLTNLNLSHDMATAMRDRAKAKFQAETKNIDTDAEARRIRELGKANGEAAKEQAAGPLLGRAEGLKKMMDDLGVTGEATLTHFTVVEGWPKSTVIAGASNGTADILGVLKAGAETLKSGE